MISRTIVFVFSLLYASLSLSQTDSLLLKSSIDGEPIPFARVKLFQSGRLIYSPRTDFDGIAVFRDTSAITAADQLSITPYCHDTLIVNGQDQIAELFSKGTLEIPGAICDSLGPDQCPEHDGTCYIYEIQTTYFKGHTRAVPLNGNRKKGIYLLPGDAYSDCCKNNWFCTKHWRGY